MHSSLRGLNVLQKISMSIMGVLVLITFIASNLHAVFWQTSDWLVSTVLPAVVIDLTNEERADNSAPELVRNPTLDAAAKLKAHHMAENEYFSHYSPDGVSPWHWFSEAGYEYAHAGENLAIHFTDSSEVIDAWMKSPSHRQNIVNDTYTEIGVGTAKGEYEGYKTVYVVQLFGTPAVTPNPFPESQEIETELAAVPEPSPMPVLEVAPESEIVVAAGIETPEPAAEPFVPVVVSEPVSETVLNEIEEQVLVVAEETEPASIESVVPAVKTLEVPVVQSEEVTVPSEIVVIESPIISTSSGLAVANITTPKNSYEGLSVPSLATQPNALLQITYIVLGFIVLALLIVSAVIEARRLHFVQVAYSALLLAGMGSLWFVHSLLTTGAVIV